MEKIALLILVAGLMIFPAKAQMAGTRWRGVVHLSKDVSVLWQFDKDTVTVTKLPGVSVIEMMSYWISQDTIFFKKIAGTSPCDTVSVGSYHFTRKDDQFFLSVITDACNARKYSASTEPYTKVP